MAWRCFMIKEAPFVQISLRRYGAGGHNNCPTTFPGINSYHNAEVVIGPQEPAALHELRGDIPSMEDRQDPRWPKTCACGYNFHPEDNWQRNVDMLYEGCPDGKLYTLNRAPVGAIWRAPWLEGLKPDNYGNDAGEVWCMRLPGRDDWVIYSKIGEPRKRWDITGELPRITVRPSILIEGIRSYHGYVNDGVISDDVDGRTFPLEPSSA